MHYAKYQKGAVSNILLHSDRGIDSSDTHEHSNESIDRSRTHLNYDLKDRNGQTAYAYHKERIDMIAKETKERTGKSIRKDAVTLCSWIVTAPQSLPEDKLEQFFKECYAWFSDRYGENNVITAAVHMDKTTPHMHFQFIPIVEKKGIRKLCAKDIETPKTLKTVHPKLQKHLTERLGCMVELMNGATENGNLTITQLKANQLEQRVSDLQQKEQKAILNAAEAENKATLEEDRAESAVLSAGNAEIRAEAAKKELEETKHQLAITNREFEAAAKDLESVLDMKARASEIHKISHLFGETVEYSKTMLESTRAIGSEAYKNAKKAYEERQEATRDRAETEAMKNSIESSYERANAEREQAIQERKKQQQLRENMEQEIEKRADELAEKKIAVMFGNVPRGKAQRLQEFCENIKYDDGTSVLDKFNQQELNLLKRSQKRSKSRGDSGLE